MEQCPQCPGMWCGCGWSWPTVLELGVLGGCVCRYWVNLYSGNLYCSLCTVCTVYCVTVYCVTLYCAQLCTVWIYVLCNCVLCASVLCDCSGNVTACLDKCVFFASRSHHHWTTLEVLGTLGTREVLDRYDRFLTGLVLWLYGLCKLFTESTPRRISSVSCFGIGATIRTLREI